MTSTTAHSSGPWLYHYSPYTLQASDAAGEELPAFEIVDAGGNKVFDSNEDTPCELQEANAILAAAAPSMLEALLLAQEALNTAPRFRVGDTDSYKIAAMVDKAINEATGQEEAMTTHDDDILDDLFHGCALAAFIDQAAEEQGPPGSEATRRRAYRYYEETLAERHRQTSPDAIDGQARACPRPAITPAAASRVRSQCR